MTNAVWSDHFGEYEDDIEHLIDEAITSLQASLDDGWHTVRIDWVMRRLEQMKKTVTD